jgi:FHA domain
MQLELKIENTTSAWILTPDRVYIIGTDSQCDIVLPAAQSVRAKHLKFSFNQANNAWYFEDTIGKRGLIVNNQLAANGLISGITKIALSNSFAIIATPEFATAPVYTAPVAPPSAPPNYPPPNSYPQPEMSGGLYSNPPVASGNLYSTPASNRVSASVPRATLAELRSLSWGQYVKKQVKEQGDSFFKRLTVNYVLLTGFRITPWLKRDEKAIEGYIIPNFEGSIQAVVTSIEQELGLLRQYEDTDCYISELTDAHIVNSETQEFEKAELFPIVRSKVHHKGDYRRFCITAYHRVKTYLLVERYGPDLFVSMVTRFEPMPSSIPILLWLILACLFLLLSWMAKSINIGDANIIFIGFTPLALWATIFMLVPQLMSMLRILPKKANGVLVRNVTIGLVSLCLLSLIANQAFLLLFVLFFATMLFAWTRSISSGVS